MGKAQIVEERHHSRRAVARKETTKQRKVAREKPEHVGLVVQRGVKKEATTMCTPTDEDDSAKR